MSVRFALSWLLALVACTAVRAQAPEAPPQNDTFYTDSIIDVWQLNIEASQFPGPKPRFGLPWQPLDDGEFLIGLPFEENAQGDAGFVFVPSGVPRPRLRAGWPRVRREETGARADEYTAKFDSSDGQFLVAVTRTDSADGNEMTLTADLTGPRGNVLSYVLIFDKQ